MVRTQTLKLRASTEAAAHWCSLEKVLQKIRKFPTETSVVEP